MELRMGGALQLFQLDAKADCSESRGLAQPIKLQTSLHCRYGYPPSGATHVVRLAIGIHVTHTSDMAVSVALCPQR